MSKWHCFDISRGMIIALLLKAFAVAFTCDLTLLIDRLGEDFG